MRILILGGTKFLGRHLVDAARTRQHEVTLFNRGLSNPNLFPDIENLIGDRDSDLAPLKGRRWDAVIDTSGVVPRIVKATALQLVDSVDHYTFLSTVSAYEDRSVFGIDESSATAQLSEENSENVPLDYRGLKARCEQEVANVMGARSLNVRAGLLVGPYDDSGRFTYWPRRVARGGRVLAPGRPDRPVQFIHARDLANWIIRMAETRRGGTFNATGPDQLLTMEEFLTSCRTVTRSDARFTWVDEQFLLDREVIPFTELPLWLRTVTAGMLAVNIDKALAEGLTFRPLADTISETLAWDRARAFETDEYAARLYNASETKAGLKKEREESLLAEWDANS